jgi:hypothetical protein
LVVKIYLLAAVSAVIIAPVLVFPFCAVVWLARLV